MRKIAAPVAMAAAGFLFIGGGVAVADIADPFGANRLTGDKTTQVIAEAKEGPAKNVILLIGDGMGDQEITQARNYEVGAGGTLPGIDAVPLTGQMTTYSVTAEGDADYVPDSAATGTGWATGQKTYDNAVSVDHQGNPLKSILKYAKDNGLKTGNVTTSEVQDATPAVLAASVKQRACYSPSRVEQCGDDALDKGGAGSISEQHISTRADLTMGGGAEYFDDEILAGEYEGQTVLESAEAEGFNVINTADELEALTVADQEAPVLGLFEPKNMVREWAETVAPVGGYYADDAVTCQPNPEVPSTSPDLAAMTSKSLELLENDKGFFLQVEGASIDKADHARDACGQIGETIAFDKAVQEALAFAEADGETLVIVTADHSHNAQLTEGPDDNVPSIRLLTNEGSEMGIVYPSGGHSGTQIRVAAYGPGAANVTGLIDQTDLFGIMSRGLQLDTDAPDDEPTTAPTESPSSEPSETPTGEPTESPSGDPTETPSGDPTETPSGEPTETPTGEPSGTPGGEPTGSPSTDGDGAGGGTDGGSGADTDPAPNAPRGGLAETGGPAAIAAIAAGIALLGGSAALWKQRRSGH